MIFKVGYATSNLVFSALNGPKNWKISVPIRKIKTFHPSLSLTSKMWQFNISSGSFWALHKLFDCLFFKFNLSTSQSESFWVRSGRFEAYLKQSVSNLQADYKKFLSSLQSDFKQKSINNQEVFNR